jgi:hypothetical protein
MHTPGAATTRLCTASGRTPPRHPVAPGERAGHGMCITVRSRAAVRDP